MANAFEEIAEISKKHKKVQTLIHYVNKENLILEHEEQKEGKAPGIDGITKEIYGEALEGNIDYLLKSMKQFSYKPKPVRRTYIPKVGSNKKRPLGIPSYEDKLVQGVMRKILDEIYEHQFYDFSYGFRRGKNAHKAIKEINEHIMTKPINYVVDADIKSFFDNVDHDWLMKFLRESIQDKNFLRYIKRFLKSGIVEELKFYESDKGTPQGGLVSPVLANVYLHYVLDMWFEKVVKKHCKGTAEIVRYADDFTCFFQYETDANKFYESLKKRLKKFGLELSTDKTKIIEFGRFAKERSKNGKTETFDFLGFTHINGKTRKGAYRLVIRSSEKKLKNKRKVVKKWLRKNMHGEPAKVIKRLNKKLVGHYAYYGVSGNYKGLVKFYKYVVDTFYKTLRRRSQRTWLNKRRYQMLLDNFPILKPKIYVNIW